MEDRAVAVVVVLVLRAIMAQPRHLDEDRAIQGVTVTVAQERHQLDLTTMENIHWGRQRMVQIRSKVRNVYM